MKSKTIIQIVLIFGVLFLLGSMAWSFGWVARVVLSEWRDGMAPEPTAAPTTPASASPAPTPTSTPVVATHVPTAAPDQTSSPPTSTPRPTAAASPTPEIRTYTVQQGDYLAKIAGTVCPNLSTWLEKSNFAKAIARRNGISYVGYLSAGTVLEIPPCP
jgi:Tfp pilus assembly protein FimV